MAMRAAASHTRRGHPSNPRGGRHAACYAHALVPSSLESARDALDGYARGATTKQEALDELSQAAAMVRSNAHADASGAYAAAMVELALRAPAATTPAERRAAAECFEAVLALDGVDAAARARLDAARDATAGAEIPARAALEARSVKELKALARSCGVDARGAFEKADLVGALDAAR